MVKALCIREHKSPIHFHMCTLDAMESSLTCKYNKIKSGKFGRRVNSDTDLQTVIIQMRRLLRSRLIRIFTACLGNLFLFQYLNIPDFTLHGQANKILVPCA